MAELAEQRTEFVIDEAPAATARPVVDTTSFEAPVTPAANEPDVNAPLSDLTEDIDVFNDGGGKPGKNLTVDQMSKKFFLELAAVGNIGGNGGGPLNQLSPEEQEERFREQMDALAKDREEKAREREEMVEREMRFARTTYDFGGMKITGEEINAQIEALNRPGGREKFEKDLREKEGLSEAEAKKRRENYEEALELLKKRGIDKPPLTEEEKRRLKELEAMPGTVADLKRQQKLEKSGVDLGNSKIATKSGNDYAQSYDAYSKEDPEESKVAASSPANEPVYKKPDAVAFSVSENLISDERLTPRYNAVASGQAVAAATPKPEVQVAVATPPPKLENTVQVSGSGFG